MNAFDLKEYADAICIVAHGILVSSLSTVLSVCSLFKCLPRGDNLVGVFHCAHSREYDSPDQ